MVQFPKAQADVSALAMSMMYLPEAPPAPSEHRLSNEQSNPQAAANSAHGHRQTSP